MKGIILVRDLAITEFVERAFPDWLVLSTDMGGEPIQFYPVPLVAQSKDK
jgi:hypothetical protein